MIIDIIYIYIYLFIYLFFLFVESADPAARMCRPKVWVRRDPGVRVCPQCPSLQRQACRAETHSPRSAPNTQVCRPIHAGLQACSSGLQQGV